MNDRAKEIAKKLHALAERGEGGEKINAAAILEKYMREHGITPDDLQDTQRQRRYLALEKNEIRLAGQVIGYVVGAQESQMKVEKKRKRENDAIISYMATEAERVEIMTTLEILIPLWEKELDVFYTAFVVRQNILVKSTGKPKEMTKVEYQERLRAELMAKNITKAQLQKRLN